MNKEGIYLSVIYFSRNDNYGGDSLKKINASINHFLSKCEQHNITNEVIIVDWNLVEDKPTLREDLSLQKTPTNQSLKFIEVSPQYHDQFSESNKRGLFNSVASNIGIRRAKGTFITRIALDVFWSDDIYNFLSQKSLKKGVIYRCNRHDTSISTQKLISKPISLYEDYLNENVSLVHHRLEYPKEVISIRLPQLHTNASGDFQLMHRDHWFKIRGYYKTKTVASEYIDGQLAFTAYTLGIQEVMLPESFKVFKIAHNFTNNLRMKAPMPINSKFNFISDNVKKNRLYSYVSTLIKVKLLEQPTSVYGIKIDSYEKWLYKMALMIKNPNKIIKNDVNWGMANKDFPTYEILRSGDTVKVNE